MIGPFAHVSAKVSYARDGEWACKELDGLLPGMPNDVFWRLRSLSSPRLAGCTEAKIHLHRHGEEAAQTPRCGCISVPMLVSQGRRCFGG